MDNSPGVTQLKKKQRPSPNPEAKARQARIRQENLVAEEIAKAMGETEDKPRTQIRNVIRLCGIPFTQAAYEDALKIEANGGLLVLTGERRRTLGGVFFQLVRERIDQDTRERIFLNWVYKQKEFVKKESVYEPFVYAERAPILTRLLANPGEVKEVNITLIGRHTEIERRQALVIVAMRSKIAEGYSMPVGVPTPPPETNFIVYISIRQWEKLEPVLQADSNDMLMVTGFCGYDEEMQSLVVYTTNATTRKTYKMERQARQRALQQAQQQQAQSDGKKQQKQAGRGNQGQQQPRGSAGRPNREMTSKYLTPPPQKSPQKSKPYNKPVQTQISPQMSQPPQPTSQPAPTPVSSTQEQIEGLPSTIAETLRKLYSAAATYRQKIEDIKSKPETQQFGLEMTEKLLASTEKQIASLEKQYKK